MNRLGFIISAAALLGLAGNGAAHPVAQSDTLWVSVCGRPDMQIAIEIDREPEQPSPGDCAKACHAATCRKALNTADRANGDGAMV